MASNFKISTAGRNAACDGLVDLLDVGGAGTIGHRTGAPPTNVADADSGTLLGTNTFSSTAFGAASAGVATAAAITDDSSADATGTAGHFRLYNNAGTCVAQGTSGEAADTPDMVFDDSSIVISGRIACSSMTITMPIQ